MQKINIHNGMGLRVHVEGDKKWNGYGFLLKTVEKRYAGFFSGYRCYVYDSSKDIVQEVNGKNVKFTDLEEIADYGIETIKKKYPAPTIDLPYL